MKRWMLCVLAAVLFLTAACGKTAEAVEEEDGVTGILTGVFREKARYAFGEDSYIPLGSVYCGGDSGALTVFEYRTEYNGDSDRTVLDARLRTVGADGEIVSVVGLPGEEAEGEGTLFAWDAYVTADRVYWISCRNGNEGRSAVLHAAEPDGGNHVTAPLEGIFPSLARGTLSSHLASETDGTVWISAGAEIACLSPSLETQFSVTAPGPVTALGVTPEGVPMFGCGSGDDSYFTSSVCAIDKGSRQYAEVRDIAGEAQSSRMGVSLFFGGGYDYFYVENRHERTPGIVGVKDGEDTLVLNRNNSAVEEDASLAAVIDPETVLYQLGDGRTLVAYGHAPDIDLSEVPTIEIACANWFSVSDLEAKAARYNRSHPEVRVVVTECVKRESYYEDTDRLIFDLGNGFYKPDIILGQCGGPVLTTVLQKNLWTDLSPMLDGDPLVNRDNLFDSVEKLFSTKDGKLWGLTPEFSVSTMIGRRDVLGRYADKGSWTMEEFIGFARSLPEGTLLSPYITKRHYGPMLGTAGFNHWIDYENASCHFEDADFIAFLAFFRDLPEGPDDIMKKYPFGEAVIMQSDFTQYSRYFQNGQVALHTSGVQSIADLLFELDLKFGTVGTDDLVLMGCPASSEDGVPANDLSADNSFVITKTCSDPDRAWDVLRSFFDVAAPNSAASQSGFFPALISEFDEQAEWWKTHWYFVAPDQRNRYTAEKGEEEVDRAAHNIPEDAAAFTMEEEDYRRIRAFLDSDAGTSAVDFTPDGIAEIIDEEISVMLGKGSSEEECAKAVQSRVSIWLSENK